MPYLEHEPWDHFPTRLTMKMMMEPFGVIREFFDHEIDIADARKELHLWWRSAFCQECLLNKAEIVSLIGFRDQLVTVVEAAAMIPEHHEVITMEEHELLNPANFCGQPHQGFTPWDYFPRHLDKVEFMNPHIMVTKFFVYKNLPEWRDVLEELFSAAISDCNIFSCSNDEDILKSCDYIMKLLEALYLMKIRKG